MFDAEEFAVTVPFTSNCHQTVALTSYPRISIGLQINIVENFFGGAQFEDIRVSDVVPIAVPRSSRPGIPPIAKAPRQKQPIALSKSNP